MRRELNTFKVSLAIYQCPDKPTEIQELTKYTGLEFIDTEGTRSLFLKYTLKNASPHKKCLSNF